MAVGANTISSLNTCVNFKTFILLHAYVPFSAWTLFRTEMLILSSDKKLSEVFNLLCAACPTFSCYLTSFITSNGSFLTKHTLSTIFYPSSHTTLLESTFNELFALTASSVGLPQPGLHWPLGFRGEHEPWGCVAWWLLFYLGTRNTQSWVDGGDLESKWGSKMNTDVDIDATTSRLKFDPFADDING